MKRVVALPGETIASTRRGWITIDGTEPIRPAKLEHQRYLGVANIDLGRKYLVTSGYYVLGDNTMDSNDSRFEGAIPERRVVGRVRAIVWPPTRARLL